MLTREKYTLLGRYSSQVEGGAGVVTYVGVGPE
jgi:hypothetical protein